MLVETIFSSQVHLEFSRKLTNNYIKESSYKIEIISTTFSLYNAIKLGISNKIKTNNSIKYSLLNNY